MDDIVTDLQEDGNGTGAKDGELTNADERDSLELVAHPHDWTASTAVAVELQAVGMVGGGDYQCVSRVGVFERESNSLLERNPLSNNTEQVASMIRVINPPRLNHQEVAQVCGVSSL